MAQEKSWNREYLEPKMLSGSDKPLSAFLSFLKYLRKKGLEIDQMRALDLGSGVGKNSNYLATRGAKVSALEISKEAIRVAKLRAEKLAVSVDYLKGDIGRPLPFDSEAFELLIDATSSNALSTEERTVYLNEAQRVLSPGGYFFVRALLIDGDKNAQNLIKKFPGPEPETYRLPELNIFERAFTEKGFIETYGQFFKIEKLIKTEGRVSISGKIFKRRYLVAYLIKQ